MAPERPHNRLKSPFYALILVIGLGLVVCGVVLGSPAIVMLAAVAVVISIAGLVMVRSKTSLVSEPAGSAALASRAST